MQVEGDADYRWENCKEYIGQWSADMREGVGVMTCRDGTLVEGLWAKDHFRNSLDKDVVSKVQQRLVRYRI